MPAGADPAPIQLVGPAAIGRASDGTAVFHTGLWLGPSQSCLFIGIIAEGGPSRRPKRPSITISNGQDLLINSFSFVGGGGGPGHGDCWLLQADVDTENAWRLSGATLVMRYEILALDYTAQLADLTKQ
ncbi:hypothetical protein [Kribbella italica]|uniref:Uncharacterized protein n=1 Tax=Kribbella italica TaxID=1540520 RepID=A0A7W9JGI1_9ACTN|nr:hypothetical protein [Kribbella italica]MBB5841673.1 hypothetical protein [Kribbella italica]